MDLLHSIATLLIVIPLFIFWVWMFRAMVGDSRLAPNERIVWAIGFVVFGLLAAIFYYVTAYIRDN